MHAGKALVIVIFAIVAVSFVIYSVEIETLGHLLVVESSTSSHVAKQPRDSVINEHHLNSTAVQHSVIKTAEKAEYILKPLHIGIVTVIDERFRSKFAWQIDTVVRYSTFSARHNVSNPILLHRYYIDRDAMQISTGMIILCLIQL